MSIGIGKGTVSLDDFEHCELIIAMGHNPGTNHPRMMGTLHEASRRGVPIIVFNPLKERALERFTDPQNPVEMATLGSKYSSHPGRSNERSRSRQRRESLHSCSTRWARFRNRCGSASAVNPIAPWT